MASEKKAAPGGGGGGGGVSDVGAWVMNVLSSVGIIMANKQVMSTQGYGFQFATTLTAFHFTVTALVGYISALSSNAPYKTLPFWDLFWFSLIANSSIVCMNLSLMLNSVGFYQISKLSMIPVVCILEWLLHNKTYTREVKAAVFIVVFGVGVCTVTDVHINLKGFISAVFAISCTSLQQIYIGSFQKKFSIGSFELLSRTAPIQAASLLVFGPFCDYVLNGKNLLKFQFTPGSILFISLSCALAVFCNLSQYICIGRFSAVSFQVLGHMKTVCVLLLGWMFFDSTLNFKNIMGMLMAVLGMVLYSSAMEAAKQSPLKIVPIMKDVNYTDEDVSLLKGGFGSQDIEGGKENLK